MIFVSIKHKINLAKNYINDFTSHEEKHHPEKVGPFVQTYRTTSWIKKFQSGSAQIQPSRLSQW